MTILPCDMWRKPKKASHWKEKYHFIFTGLFERCADYICTEINTCLHCAFRFYAPVNSTYSHYSDLPVSSTILILFVMKSSIQQKTMPKVTQEPMPIFYFIVSRKESVAFSCWNKSNNLSAVIYCLWIKWNSVNRIFVRDTYSSSFEVLW